MDKNLKKKFMITKKNETSGIDVRDMDIENIDQIVSDNNLLAWQTCRNKITFMIKTNYYKSQSLESIKTLNSIIPKFLLTNKYLLYVLTKFVLYEKIKSENISEIKKFYDEQFFPLLEGTHLKNCRSKNENFKIIMNNPNILRSYSYMIKSEEYFQNFISAFEKKLKKFMERSESIRDDDVLLSNLEEELVTDSDTAFISNFDKKINLSHNDNSNLSSNIINVKQNSSLLKIHLDPIKDRSSNYHASKKGYIPKTRKEIQTFKEKIPLLKNFNPTYTKRANIDKKIIRNFRKFLKYKLDDNSNLKIFWTKFIRENLYPPMKMYDNDIKKHVEFKSLNTEYLVWLFGKEGAVDYYKEFLEREGKNILDSLIKDYDLNEKAKDSQIKKEVENLQFYIFHFGEVLCLYSKEALNSNKSSDTKLFTENYFELPKKEKVCLNDNLGAAPVDNTSNESIYENYLGQNFDIKLDKEDIFKFQCKMSKSIKNKKKNQRKDETESSDASLERSRKLDNLIFDNSRNSFSNSSEE